MYNGYIVKDSTKNRKIYDGTTLKFGITVSSTDYIIKLPEDNSCSVWTEYIASRFIASLNIPAHKVWTGRYNKKQVSIIEDFTTASLHFVSFKDTRQSCEGTDISNKTYTYEDVLDMLDKHTKMDVQNKDKAIHQFWRMFICDAVLGNRDRHHGNWGLLSDGVYSYPAPVFDNAATLFPDANRTISEFQHNPYNFLCQFFFIAIASLIILFYHRRQHFEIVFKIYRLFHSLLMARKIYA